MQAYRERVKSLVLKTSLQVLTDAVGSDQASPAT
jgi:hypothetical protein